MKKIILKLRDKVRISSDFSNIIELHKDYFSELKQIDNLFRIQPKYLNNKSKLYTILKIIKDKDNKIVFLFNGIDNINSLRRIIIKSNNCPFQPYINLYNYLYIYIQNDDLALQYCESLLELVDSVEDAYLGTVTIVSAPYLNIYQPDNIPNLPYQTDLEFDRVRSRFKPYFSFAPYISRALRIGKYTGRGRNILFFDIENGWFVEHPYLSQSPDMIPQDGTVNNGLFGSGNHSHGTKVLGVLIANESLKGIVPDISATTVEVGAIFELALLRAIVEAYEKKGSIILIELGTIIIYNENTNISVPMEYNNSIPKNNNLIRKLIKLATKCLEITIIEPAGNNSNEYRNFDHEYFDNYFNEGFDLIDDTGSIMVGAVNYGIKEWQYKLKIDSCYGRRVDTFVWGENITTTDYNENDPESITTNFSQTSAASAIVAGICASLQSISVNEYGKAIPPLVLRSWLQNNPKKLDVNVDLTTTTFEMPKMSDLINKLENYHNDL